MDIQKKYEDTLKIYNKLEKLFKASQIVQGVFEIPVLNEYRYISRALVDYNLTNEDAEKQKSLSKLEVAIAAAYNDIIDSILMTIKFTINRLKNENPLINATEILEEYNYKEVAHAINKAETVVINSRGTREKRLQEYEVFSNSKDYDLLINFCINLHLIEYQFDLAANQAKNSAESTMLHNVYEAFNNKNSDPGHPIFELWYQPKCSQDRQIIGAEALIRLRINGKVLSPIAFLGAINQSRLEKLLDIWVLENAAKTISEYKEKFPLNFDIAINVTPTTIADYQFIELFNHTIKENQIEENLSIEIVETWNNEQDDEHIKAHYRLGEINDKTKIAIDDFGSGSTMLEYIVMISNLDMIKIDKILTDKLETKNKEKAKQLISGIIELARKTNLEVIVEGVETEGQFEILKGLGVQKFQGYLFYKPMDLTEFLGLIVSSDKI